MIKTAMIWFLTLFAGSASASLIQGPLGNVWRELSTATHIGFHDSTFQFGDVQGPVGSPGIESKLNNVFGEGNALAVATDLPIVVARTHAHKTTELDGITTSVADARLSFFVAVDTRFGVIDALGRVPVRVEAQWDVHANHGSAEVAAAFSGLSGIDGIYAKVESGLFADSDAGTLSQSTQMGVGSIIGVGMIARVGSIAMWTHLNVNLFDTADAFAALDPVFSFDQAAFDAERAAAGLDTFKLDEVYQFVFSPGIQNLPSPSLVPLPPAFTLLLPGITMLLAGGTWRRQVRSR